MNLEYYIAKRITLQSKRTFSKTIVRIAISAIALSIIVMMISISILDAFQSEIKNKIIGFGSHIQITNTNVNFTYENPAINIEKKLINKINNVEGVKSVNVFATKAGIIKTKNAIEGVVLKGVNDNYDWSEIENYIIEGDVITFEKNSSSKGILISKTLSDKLMIDVGDKIEIYFVQKPPRARKLTVSGIFKTGLEEIDNTFAICDLKHIIKLNNWESNQAGGYEIKIEKLENLEIINDEIRLELPLKLDSRTIKEIYPQLFDWLGLLDKNVQIILILMLIVAAVNMITALLIIILEKTNMIGILKAFGTSNWRISKIFIYNASFLIILGVVFGNILGLLLLFLQHHFNIVKLPVEYYFIDSVPVAFTWGKFLFLNIGTIIFCGIMMYFPARFVARIDPVKSIRFE
ncbi:MAG: FtsX-like permease family protein [Bacteroidota bacterium]|nr:FtsX-like permease family protein [Bacteroidota bacterium]